MRKIIILLCAFFWVNSSPGTNFRFRELTKKTGNEGTVAAVKSQDPKSEVILLSSLKMDEALCSERPQINRSFGGRPITIGSQKYETGIGTHARSVLWVNLQGGSKWFTAMVGIDDEVVPTIVRNELRSAFRKGYDEYLRANGHVIFQIYGDGKLLWKSPVMRAGMPAQKVDVDLSGVQTMVMVVSSAGDAVDFDHADWADAMFIVTGAKPQPIAPPREAPYILTPKASSKPQINGAGVFGVRPGSPFLFTIAATGERPMKFDARNLPQGLRLDPVSGQITGSLKNKGEWIVSIMAANSLGNCARRLKISCNNTLSLTPPMGWNSWNVFGGNVKESHVRAAADAMVKSGLINHGWNFINIDDCWQIKHSSKDTMLSGQPRDANGMINTNKKFPDMKSLCDYIHSKGLKAGIYSSPGLYTCQGHTGSFQYEEKDAQRYAEWGFDYLKYDWCYMQYSTKDVSLYEQRIPWAAMSRALAKTKRDIIFSLSETLDVWPWATEIGANSWRTTGDITGLWSSIDEIGFNQNGREVVAGPGHWNDCDMFVVGKMNGGKSSTRLTPNEQYTHITLWSLLASPMLIGCDMTQLDDFTLNLLTNDEVIAVNQDPLGIQAHRISKDENVEVWAKKMEDGTFAVGLFNRGEYESRVTVNLNDLHLAGKQTVRDLWRQKDMGIFADSFTASVARHGAMMIRLKPNGK